MAKFAVTLKSGHVIEVHADDEASAIAHTKATADAFAMPTQVGPKYAGAGQPMQIGSVGNPEKADRSQPVSAKRVK